MRLTKKLSPFSSIISYNEIEEQVEKLNGLVQDLETAKEALQDALDNLDLPELDTFREVRSEYIETQEKLSKMAEQVAIQLQDEFDEKSERYKESEAGEEAQSWIDDWEQLQFEAGEADDCDIRFHSDQLDEVDVWEIDLPPASSTE